MLPLDFTKWILQGAYLTEKYDVVINPKGYIKYNITGLSDEERLLSKLYRVRVNYASPIQINRFAPTIMSEVTFEYKKYSQEQVMECVSISAHPTVDIGTYSLVDFLPIAGETDTIAYKLCNYSDSPITVSAIEFYPSYDLDDNTESILEQKLPAAKNYTNALSEVISGRRKAVATVDFAVSSSATGVGSVFTTFYSDYEGIVTSNITHNGTTVLPADAKISIRKGYNMISIPFYIASTSKGDNKIEWYLQCSNSFAIEPQCLQLIIESKNMLSTTGNSASDIKVLEVIKPGHARDMSTQASSKMFVDKRHPYQQQLPKVSRNISDSNVNIELY